MAGHLNTNCDFNSGFFVCDIPRDAIQVSLKIKTKWGKHTLTEDSERQMESIDHGRSALNTSRLGQ